MQHWVLKEYAKLVSNHLQMWSGGFSRRGKGGARTLLVPRHRTGDERKLQLQDLKKRRVPISLLQTTTISFILVHS